MSIRGNAMKYYEGKRKHGSQLKPFETTGLWKRLKSVQEWEWTLSDHVFDRLIQKEIRATKQDIVSTVHNASIIEYRIIHSHFHNALDERVILRSKAVVNGHYNLNVVYSLTFNEIITVWINSIDDRHDTLKWEIYDENMKVFGV